MKYEEGTNYVRYACDVARTTWDWEKRRRCNDAADALELAIKKFTQSWSLSDARDVQGAFTRCYWAVDKIVPKGGGDLPSGRMPLPKEKAA